MQFVGQGNDQFGIKAAMQQNKDLLNGLNVHDGKLTYKAVAEAQGLEYTDPASLIL